MESSGADAAVATGLLAGAGIFMLVWLAIVVFFIAVMWKIFAKAGQPGWAAIVPIYNTIVFLQIAGKPWWWLFLFCIPVVGLIFAILATASLSTNFGKGGGFTAGLILLPFIFFPILAFGSAEYQGVQE